jgi:NADPH-dependent glutamate synthase beta subunit-like oxidoreductase/Pyruvate/2-oxoacid:ferredoxin oxidoreductase delta subunit
VNEAPQAIWTTGSTEGIKTGSCRVALPIYVNPPSPCHAACPVDSNIAVWIRHIENRAYHEAWLTLTDNNPLPAVAGRVCHRPCETICNRGALDEPVAIRCLERFIGDMALEHRWALPPAPVSNPEAIAIVGAGPAGLSAAFQLRRAGYAVTLIEAKPQLGGVLRYGIPSYRLPRDVLDAEIRRILDLGIETRTSARVSTRADFENLQSEFAAVYIASGASVAKRLPQLDYTQPWVIDSGRYLEQCNAGDHPRSGVRTVVIGGGSAAMDVARTARRHGKEVTVLSLEPEQMMPAQVDEVRHAKAEGVRLFDGAMLQSVSDRAQDGLELQCIRVHFEAGATPGEFEVTPIHDRNFTIDADIVVPAIGQIPDISGLQDLLESDGTLLRIDERHQTSRAGIFAGGDLVSMQRFVTAAFGFGKRAAIEIDSYLKANTPNRDLAVQTPVTIDVINTNYYPRAERATQPLLPLAERQAGFGEVELTLDPDTVFAESRRCFKCGHCTLCDNCFYYCPDIAINREQDGYSVNEDYCKGCGLCVAECPTGSITMRQETR